MSTLHKIDSRDFVNLLGPATGGIVLGSSSVTDEKNFIPTKDS